MFDFLFRRSASKKKPLSPIPVPAQHSNPPAAAAESAKLAALAKADSFAADELAAAAFILECGFADARLKAAAHIQTRSGLEKVHKAMRNVDRRVAKLMQARLNALEQQEMLQKKTQECIGQAQRLQHEPQLTPSQVAELDRKWQSVAVVPPAEQAAFKTVRTVLTDRLASQTALQRAVLDTHARLRSLGNMPEPLAPALMLQTLSQLEAEMASHLASPEAPSLPKQPLLDFSLELQRIKDSQQRRQAEHEQRLAAFNVRQETLAAWEAAEPASLVLADIKRAWRNLPALGDDPALPPLQVRFDALIAQVAAANPAPESPVAAPELSEVEENQEDARKQFSQTLDAMEKALQDGSLQAASEHDRSLRSAALKSVQPSAAQAQRLGQARSELSRLQGWAKWGGNVSREELIKAVEELPAQQLAVPELAKKVGSLRERWKALDAASGAAPRSLWERFDAACNLAYEPAAAHFRQLAQERLQNMEAAQALIAQVRQLAADAKLNGADQPQLSLQQWKDIAVFCQRCNVAWHRLGIIDRKERKRLDAEFQDAIGVLERPLAAQQQIEIRRREDLIAEVGQIDAADRAALKTLQGCQERWQEQARSLPLERRDEQALWLRFRSACDDVFARRRESAEAADADRKHNAVLKEAVCSELEAALADEQANLNKLVRDSRAAWDGIGALPRAVEGALTARYEAALAAAKARLDVASRARQEAELQALRRKLKLCQGVEAALVNGLPPQDDWMRQWQALPPLKAGFEQAMQRRFQAALGALQATDHKYAGELEQNRAELAQELLRLEILAGHDSPPELARERLKMQVDVLQLSLRAGQTAPGLEERLLHLCGLPALADEQASRRIEQLLSSIST